MKKTILVIAFIIFISLIFYFFLRINSINQIDKYSDSFFADFSNADKDDIKKHLYYNNHNIENTIDIIEKYKEAIINFNYTNSKPSVNLMLDKANVEVSWHLTIEFKKQKNVWYILKFNEYREN